MHFAVTNAKKILSSMSSICNPLSVTRRKKMQYIQENYAKKITKYFEPSPSLSPSQSSLPSSLFSSSLLFSWDCTVFRLFFMTFVVSALCLSSSIASAITITSSRIYAPHQYSAFVGRAKGSFGYRRIFKSDFRECLLSALMVKSSDQEMIEDEKKEDDESIASSSLSSDSLVAEAYKSRSTSIPDGDNAIFHLGSEMRRKRLDEALVDIGIDPNKLSELPEYRGSAALRTYSSFILPKSSGALAMTNQPQRAAIVANNIAFLMQEHRSRQINWIRNHDRSLREVEEQLGNLRNPITIILDNVRSAHNVGNILRAAEAAGCQRVILCGSMTPAPPHPKVLKTALGAAEYVPYQIVGSTLEAIRELKQQQENQGEETSNNILIVGVETTSRSVSLWETSFFDTNINSISSNSNNESKQVAFVFGNELVGVDKNVLEECDKLVAVPTHGIKNSLNVANCVSVVVWEALRQWNSDCRGNNNGISMKK